MTTAQADHTLIEDELVQRLFMGINPALALAAEARPNLPYAYKSSSALFLRFPGWIIS